MANQLTMAEIDTIVTLHKSGHTQREIAALLGVNRGTVGRYLAKAKAQNQPQAPTGNSPCDPNGCAAENNAGSVSAGTHSQSQPQAPTGSKSKCDALFAVIIAKVEQGLEAVRIHQDLVQEHGKGAPSYYSVRRFIARLREKTPLPFRRMETEAGEEAQVDFGTGALVRTTDSKPRRPWIFRIVLSYSRKGYSEAVWRQNSEAFMQCLENAFSHFGGVPKRLVIDNLKAAVARADWYDPEVHPKLQSFAQHYGTVFMPTKSYTPRHKGKIESGVKYVKRNALKARVFTSLAEENEFLLHWETQIADQRIHGTTKQQVEKVSGVERGTIAMLRQVASIGPYTRQWSEAMTQARGVEGVRVLMGLKHLAGKHDYLALEEACRVALSHGAYRLKTLRTLLKRQGQAQAQFEFLEEHPIIRPLSDYSLESLLQFRKDR